MTIEAMKQALPVAYLAWRDGNPCWDGDDCVCEDAVYPVDADDDRVSMPVYTLDQLAAAVLRERERCAKVCEQLEVAIDGGGSAYYRPADARQCVAAIRKGEQA